MRCRFLETVRQYAEERLEESGEAEWLRARHAEYYVGVAERNARREVAGRLKTLEREYENLRAALRWSRVTDGRGETGLRIATDMASYWAIRGYPSEGRMWLNQLLKQAPDAPFEIRGRAFNWLGQLAWLEARYEESKQNYGEGLVLHTKIGNKTGIAVSRCGIGNVMRHVREYAGAREAYEEALAIYRDLGNRYGIAALLNNMGALASNERQIERAISLYEEALALSKEEGDKWGIASRMGNLAEMMTRSGRLDEAAALHKESLALWLELGDRRSMAEGLEMFVETLCAQGRMQLAARMLGAVETIREVVGCPRPPVDDELIQQAVDATRKVLGEQGFTAAWAEGRASSAEQAVASALDFVHVIVLGV
jgi:non-specific serine/threonine protein kinase